MNRSRKDYLTQIAVEMMQQRGFSALGLRDIAEAANLKASSLYSHFKSKDELTCFAMERYALEQFGGMTSLEQFETGSQRVFAYCDMIANSLLENRKLCLALTLAVERNSVSENIRIEIRKFVATNVSWLAQAWDKGRSDKTITSTLTGEEAAPVIFTAIEGMVAFALISSDPTSTFLSQTLTLLSALGVGKFEQPASENSTAQH